MPIFDYRCEKCGTIFEEFFHVNEKKKYPKKIKCKTEGCKGKAIKLIAGGQSFVFNGEGTYNKGFDSAKTSNKHKSREQMMDEMWSN